MSGLDVYTPYSNLQGWSDEKSASAKRLAMDVRVAAAWDMPVLISGPSPLCLAVARQVVQGRHDRIDLRLWDAGCGHVVEAFSRTDSAPAAAVIICDVEKLPASEQAALAKFIEQRDKSRASGRWRIVSTSSVDLFERVTANRFDARLFYMLNAIHLVVPNPPPVPHPET